MGTCSLQQVIALHFYFWKVTPSLSLLKPALWIFHICTKPITTGAGLKDIGAMILFLHFPWGLVTLPMAEFNCRLKFWSMLPNMVPWCQIVILVNWALCPESYSSQHCQFLQRSKIQKWISLCSLHQSVLFDQSSTWATNALISITVKGVIQWRYTDNVNIFIMLGLRPLPPQQNTVSLSDPQLNKSGAVFNSNYKETCCHGFLNAEKWTSD